MNFFYKNRVFINVLFIYFLKMINFKFQNKTNDVKKLRN